ncbi:MAG: VanZ family protein [Gammaproteobacteria bacterium]|jgi:VanZ family protein|nr:VanZ family protein [Gammaproteobacteria bacterium]MDP6615895.1 VanZ family protein [Gammaproteobacteria bacterium]MDP6694287.1 VanZ family protein [Gammaproteobacteria bacterium]MDP7042207.1 VanZ family protein [Gammaproteobacteria bacterium]
MHILSPDQLRYRPYWVAGGVVLLSVVLALSLVPYTGPDLPVTFADKIAHMLAFTALIVWFSSVVPQSRWPSLFGLLLTYGVFIEVMQFFTGYRVMEWGDIVADAGGLILGWYMNKAGLANWANWVERLLGVR